jgi:hypothetical protein
LAAAITRTTRRKRSQNAPTEAIIKTSKIIIRNILL